METGKAPAEDEVPQPSSQQDGYVEEGTRDRRNELEQRRQKTDMADQRGDEQATRLMNGVSSTSIGLPRPAAMRRRSVVGAAAAGGSSSS